MKSEPLFIFAKNGEVKVSNLAEAHTSENDPEWEHIATIDPQIYLTNLFRKNPRLVEALRDKVKEVKRPLAYEPPCKWDNCDGM